MFSALIYRSVLWFSRPALCVPFFAEFDIFFSYTIIIILLSPLCSQRYEEKERKKEQKNLKKKQTKQQNSPFLFICLYFHLCT